MSLLNPDLHISDVNAPNYHHNDPMVTDASPAETLKSSRFTKLVNCSGCLHAPMRKSLRSLEWMNATSKAAEDYNERMTRSKRPEPALTTLVAMNRTVSAMKFESVDRDLKFLSLSGKPVLVMRGTMGVPVS